MLSQCPTLAHINPALYVKSLSLGYFAVYSFSYCALYELYSVVAFTSKEVWRQKKKKEKKNLCEIEHPVLQTSQFSSTPMTLCMAWFLARKGKSSGEMSRMVYRLPAGSLPYWVSLYSSSCALNKISGKRGFRFTTCFPEEAVMCTARPAAPLHVLL